MPDSSPDIQQVARRLRDLALLTQANQARRCVFVKANGLRCGSPAMRGDPFCFFPRPLVQPARCRHLPAPRGP